MEGKEPSARDKGERNQEEASIPSPDGSFSHCKANSRAQEAGDQNKPEVRRVVLPALINIRHATEKPQHSERKGEDGQSGTEPEEVPALNRVRPALVPFVTKVAPEVAVVAFLLLACVVTTGWLDPRSGQLETQWPPEISLNPS
jgi:hypothetical protein